MRLRILLNSLKESFKSIVRHPLVTLASVTTIALMLVLMGGFVAVSLNANHIADNIGQQPPVEIWMELEVTTEEINGMKEALSAHPEIVEYITVTPEENFRILKENLGDDADVLSNFKGASMLPYSFQVRLKNPEASESFEKQVLGFSGVHRVDYSKKVMDSLTGIIRWVNTGTMVAFAVMCIISLFIIANMVRVSVLARREEIAIMKYVGATNTYIRMPYVLEGGIAGLLGALIATAVVYVVYDAAYARLMQGANPESFYSLLTLDDLMLPVMLINLALGVVIGALGSMVSVRKYVKV
jgi:cell division transport system permease protein